MSADEDVVDDATLRRFLAEGSAVRTFGILDD